MEDVQDVFVSSDLTTVTLTFSGNVKSMNVIG